MGGCNSTAASGLAPAQGTLLRAEGPVASETGKPTPGKYQSLYEEESDISASKTLWGRSQECCSCSCHCPDWCKHLMRCCCCCHLMLILTVAAFSSGIRPFPSAETWHGAHAPEKLDFFQADALIDSIPTAPDTYPDTMQGIFWMDAAGDDIDKVDGGLQQAAFSFGDAQFSPLENQEIMISKIGPSWVWINNNDTYATRAQVHYLIETYVWNAMYTEARIWPTQHALGRNWYGMGPSFEDLPMVFTQHWAELVIEDGAYPCPPPKDATVEERQKCAHFRRITCFLGCIGKSWGYNKPRYTYVYRIVNQEGEKVEPFFSDFTARVQAEANPDPAAAKELGLDLDTAGGDVSSDLLRGVYL